MGLDFCAVAPDGTGSRPRVSLGMDSHGELVDAAQRLGGCPLTARMADYWDDASFSPIETASLLAELRRLVSESSHSELQALLVMCEELTAARLGLRAWAD